MNVLEIAFRLVKTYPLQRAATAGAVLLSSIFGAQSLGAAVYGELAFFVFFTKALLLGNLGAISGYLAHYYTVEGSEDDSTTSKFNAAYTRHLLVLAALCLAAGFLIGQVYVFVAIGFAILIPFFVLEPRARIQRRFYVSLIPDLVLSLAVIGCTLTYTLSSESSLTRWPVLWLGIAWMLPLSTCAAWFIWPSLRGPGMLHQQVDWAYYRRIVFIGTPRFLATCAFTVFLMLDRVFLEHFYDRAELGVYMLAIQLATGSCLLLSAQNLVSGIDIGEAMRRSQVAPTLLRHLITRSLTLGGIGLGSVTVCSYLLEHVFLTGYKGLFQATTTLSLGLVGFFTAGNVTDIAYYKGVHRPLTIGLFAILAAGFAFNVLNVSVFRGTAVSLAAFSGIALATYGLASIWYMQRLSFSSFGKTPGNPLP